MRSGAGAVVRTLINPLREAEILPERTVAKVFSSTEKIVALSDELRRLLRTRLEGWDGEATLIGDVFISLIESRELLGASRFTSAYTQYAHGAVT